LRPSRAYLLVSLILAITAGALAHTYVSRAAAADGSVGPQASVVVASERIGRGSPISQDDLRVVRMPEAYAPPGSFSTIRQAAGRIVLADLAPGEAVTQTRLARVRAGPVASLVPQGLRAFAVPTSLPAGSLSPGDRVDLLATFNSGQPHTETVVEGVEVLLVLGPSHSGSRIGQRGIGLDLESGGDAPVTLVVLVSPDQEEQLAFARAFATLEVTIAPPPA
jgi:Flp pilus assembly protein CpaB